MRRDFPLPVPFNTGKQRLNYLVPGHSEVQIAASRLKLPLLPYEVGYRNSGKMDTGTQA